MFGFFKRKQKRTIRHDASYTFDPNAVNIVASGWTGVLHLKQDGVIVLTITHPDIPNQASIVFKHALLQKNEPLSFDITQMMNIALGIAGATNRPNDDEATA